MLTSKALETHGHRRPLLQWLLTAAIVLAGGCQAQGQELQLYRGLLHAHTSFSDGSGTPEEAYEMARAAGLDFFAVTEHNHKLAGGSDGVFLTFPLYEELKATADDHTEPGEFVAIYGQEVSTISASNHVNVFNASSICDINAGDFRALYESWLPNHPEVPFIQFNHPDIRKDHRASEDQKPLRIQVRHDRVEDHVVDLRLAQPRPEPHECGFIGRGIGERQADELAKADAIHQRLFDAGVREVEPLGEHQALEHNHRSPRRASGPVAVYSSSAAIVSASVCHGVAASSRVSNALVRHPPPIIASTKPISRFFLIAMMPPCD